MPEVPARRSPTGPARRHGDRGATQRLLLAERARLHVRLSGTVASEWTASTLCGGWNRQQVLAHLVLPDALSRTSMTRHLLAAREPDAALDVMARAVARKHDPAALIDLFARPSRRQLRPLRLPAAAALTEIAVHGADMFWTPDRPYGLPPAVTQAVLAFLTTPFGSVVYPSARRLRGRTLAPSDADFSLGEGPVLAGTGAELCLWALGRPILR